MPMNGLTLIQDNMFAPQDLMVILILALVLFGGKKLPDIGSALGKAMREFTRATEEWQRPFAPEHPTLAPYDDLPYEYPPVMIPPAPPLPTYWYYCDNPLGYYPYVPQCPGGWRPVPATP
jgi:TatA/E family protein of Tat protein translocase